MARWTVEIDIAAKRELESLDTAVRRRIERFLYERISQLADPRSIGQSLRGPRFGELWRYRFGDWRVLCKIEDEQLIVLALRVGHRREVYDR